VIDPVLRIGGLQHYTPSTLRHHLSPETSLYGESGRPVWHLLHYVASKWDKSVPGCAADACVPIMLFTVTLGPGGLIASTRLTCGTSRKQPHSGRRHVEYSHDDLVT